MEKKKHSKKDSKSIGKPSKEPNIPKTKITSNFPKAFSSSVMDMGPMEEKLPPSLPTPSTVPYILYRQTSEGSRRRENESIHYLLSL